MHYTASDFEASPTEQGLHPDHVHHLNQQIRPHSVNGQLRLRFEWHETSGQTVLAECAQRPPLKVVRAFPLADGAALVHLHNLSGGVLGGDHLKMQVEVGREACAQLTTTSATRLYRCQEAASDAVQLNEISVGENATLEYLPDPLIPFAGARYQQHTIIELEKGAGLFWWEIVAPGREAFGELFAYQRLALNVEIKAEGRVIALERHRLEPGLRPMNSPARLGHYRYFASFYLCRVGVDASRWLRMEKDLSELAEQLSRRDEVLWGISTLPAHGLIVRALSVGGRDVLPGLTAFWQAAKMELDRREAVLPRKMW